MLDVPDGGAVPVEVRLPTLLRPAAGGQAIVPVEADTVGGALRTLQEAYPGLSGQLLTDEGELHRFVNVYLDDDDVRYLDGLDTKVGPDSVLTILPAVAGGA
ncbi:MAG: putative sulfur carrier protein [Acidimicrobiaceae bacterium]|nr:putative sulfur carrier protein [Acidimicrobiaceae bacterium]